MFQTWTFSKMGLEFVKIPAPPGCYCTNHEGKMGVVRPFFMARTVLQRRHLENLFKNDSKLRDAYVYIPSVEYTNDADVDDLQLKAPAGQWFLGDDVVSNFNYATMIGETTAFSTNGLIERVNKVPKNLEYAKSKIPKFRIPTDHEWEWATLAGETSWKLTFDPETSKGPDRYTKYGLLESGFELGELVSTGVPTSRNLAFRMRWHERDGDLYIFHSKPWNENETGDSNFKVSLRLCFSVLEGW